MTDWADRLAIQELGVRYCNAVTRGDWAMFAATWAPDAIWEESPPLEGRAVGREAILARSAALSDSVDFFVQICHGVVVETIEGDTARAAATVQGVARGSGGQACVNFGMYYDRLIKTGGVWRYAYRRLQNIYVDWSPLAGETAIARADLALLNHGGPKHE
jgi:hypothetical protein